MPASPGAGICFSLPTNLPRVSAAPAIRPAKRAATWNRPPVFGHRQLTERLAVTTVLMTVAKLLLGLLTGPSTRIPTALRQIAPPLRTQRIISRNWTMVGTAVSAKIKVLGKHGAPIDHSSILSAWSSK